MKPAGVSPRSSTEVSLRTLAVPEIGGIIPRDVQKILQGLMGFDVIGADICEVAPCYDPTGITSVTAANLMFELTCLIAASLNKD